MTDLQPTRRIVRVGMANSLQGRARYGAALSVVSALQVAALADSDARAVRAQAREIGGSPALFADMPALLTADPPLSLDALLLTVPLSERAAQIAASAQAHLGLLAEVPFGVSLEETDKAVRAAQGTSVLLFPAFPRRFDALFEETADLIADGTIGALKQVRCEWTLPIGETEQRGDTVGNYDWNVLLQQVACQSADLGRVWFGDAQTVSADIEFLHSANGENLPQRVRARAEETVGLLLVTHERGVVIHQVSRTRAAFPGERYLLAGTQGELELRARGGTQLSTASAPTLLLKRAGQRPEVLRSGVSFAAANAARVAEMLNHFADCLVGLSRPRVLPADARAAQEIVHGAYLSAFENSKVTLPLRRSPDIEAMLRNPDDPPALTR